MNDNTHAYFDLETVALLREVLDDAWASLRPEQRATMLKTTLAERILASAAQGERDRERLLDAALMEFTSEELDIVVVASRTDACRWTATKIEGISSLEYDHRLF